MPRPGMKSHKKSKKKGHTKSQSPFTGPSVFSGHYTSEGNSISHERRYRINCLLAFLVVFSCLATIILGVFVLVGCISTTASVDSLYLTELTKNDSYGIKLRIGYFGGCVSITNKSGVASPIQLSNAAINVSGDSFGTHCITNMRDHDMDDLSEEFWEDLSLTTSALAELKNFLNVTIPQAKHLQDDIFFWQPPVFHFVFFSVSGIMLFASLASTSPRRRYKSVLVIASLIGAFALALSSVVAIGSLQALNALVAGKMSTQSKPLSEGVVFYRADILDQLQWGVVGTATVFYAVIGIIFVRRQPESEVFFSALTWKPFKSRR